MAAEATRATGPGYPAAKASFESEPRRLYVTSATGGVSIRGARRRPGPFYYSNEAKIVATHGGDVGETRWRYLSSPPSNPQFGTSFIDRRPSLPLEVRAVIDGREVTNVLRPINITGIYGNEPAVERGCVVLDDGRVHGWRDGGTPIDMRLQDVTHLCASRKAYAAVHGDGHITAWGDPDNGGQAPVIGGVAALAASGGAFAALGTDESVQAWGNPSAGGVVPSSIADELTGIVEIVGSEDAFFARRRDGRVFGWGGPWPYGMIAEKVAHAEQIVASNHAFAARMPDGTVVGWGAAEEGAPGSIGLVPGLVDISLIASSARAFAAVDRQGNVRAWGDPRFGGVAPQGLDDVIYLLGASSAFAAIRRDGTVIAWGDEKEGGRAPAGLKAVGLAAGWGTLAALRDDGGCVSWGRIGGEYRGKDAVACYVAGDHVIVLTASDALACWGNPTLDLSLLEGNISYLERITTREKGNSP